MMSVLTTAVVLMVQLTTLPPVPRSYWLAECSAWPITMDDLPDGVQLTKIRVRPGHVWALFVKPSTRQRGVLEAYRLGSREQGWSIWSVRGPTVARDVMAVSPACRVVATYQQVMAWSAPARDWLAARSTCYGSATWRGRNYNVWPCRWSTERIGQGSVSALIGIGPGVMYGGSGREAAGVDYD
jgi:hypothetical protein